MVLEGFQAFELHFNESDALSPSQQAYSEDQLKQFKSWWGNWEGASYLSAS